MKHLQVPFPKFLNAKKLFYKWEVDVVISVAASGASIFSVLLWFGTNILFSMAIASGLGYLISKQYIKFFKSKRNGYLEHLAYSKGFANPNGHAKDETFRDLIPRGYENEFID